MYASLSDSAAAIQPAGKHVRRPRSRLSAIRSVVVEFPAIRPGSQLQGQGLNDAKNSRDQVGVCLTIPSLANFGPRGGSPAHRPETCLSSQWTNRRQATELGCINLIVKLRPSIAPGPSSVYARTAGIHHLTQRKEIYKKSGQVDKKKRKETRWVYLTMPPRPSRAPLRTTARSTTSTVATGLALAPDLPAMGSPPSSAATVTITSTTAAGPHSSVSPARAGAASSASVSPLSHFSS